MIPMRTVLSGSGESPDGRLRIIISAAISRSCSQMCEPIFRHLPRRLLMCSIILAVRLRQTRAKMFLNHMLRPHNRHHPELCVQVSGTYTNREVSLIERRLAPLRCTRCQQNKPYLSGKAFSMLPTNGCGKAAPLLSHNERLEAVPCKLVARAVCCLKTM